MTTFSRSNFLGSNLYLGEKGNEHYYNRALLALPSPVCSESQEFFTSEVENETVVYQTF